MSVSSIASGFNPYSSGLSSLFHQRRLDFKAMESAIQSGDMTAAQKALSAWQLDTQNIQGARGSCPSQGSQPNSPFQSDLNALVNAVESGDATSAQTALTTFDQDRQGTFGGTGQTPSSFMSDLQSMLSAVQSGDLSSAQKDVSTLQSDIKSFMAGHHHHHGGISNLGSQSAPSGVNANALIPQAGNDGDADDNANYTGNSLNSIQLAAQAAYGALMNTQTPVTNLNTKA